jgi:signal peptidase II
MNSTFIRNAAAIALLVIIVDQAVKYAVRQALLPCGGPPVSACEQIALPGPLRLLRLENAGSSLGFLQGMSVWTFVAMLGLVLLPLYGKSIAAAGTLAAAALGLQAGGAMSNLADRALFGSVTDFIDIGIDIAFNPADIALLCGMALAMRALQQSNQNVQRADREVALVGAKHTDRSRSYIDTRSSMDDDGHPSIVNPRGSRLSRVHTCVSSSMRADPHPAGRHVTS